MPFQDLTPLGFLATGAFQRELADRTSVSQRFLSRAMPAVWDGLIRMMLKCNILDFHSIQEAPGVSLMTSEADPWNQMQPNRYVKQAYFVQLVNLCNFICSLRLIVTG